jgi:lipopolysaccharide/colanic/teichoic acid biosynthesis glycosyltransferase
MKRIFDILFSIIGLFIFLLPMIFISLQLKFKEKHPVIFKQERIGFKKQFFYILKFQTMVDHIPTKTGKFLRKTGLDEIPQFINVLKGDMSIVGPRALTDDDIKRLGWNDNFYHCRWNVKPGITGFAQIYGGQNKKTSWFWDKKYIKTHNIFIDFSLLIASFLMNFLGKTRIRRMIWPKKNLK